MEIDLSLAGTRVFLVEDEALILFSLQDMLADLGCQVVASALRIEDALAMGGTLAFDVAILDVFASGYNRASLPRAHRERALIAKPYRAAELQVALGAALSD